MLESTYNIIIWAGFICFFGSAYISIYSNSLKKKGIEYNSAFKIILIGLSAMFFLSTALLSGEVISVHESTDVQGNSACLQCDIPADQYIIFLFGFLAFLSFILFMVYLIGNLYDNKT